MSVLTASERDELARLARDIARGASPLGEAWVAAYEALVERALADAAREWRRARWFEDRREGR